MAEPFDQDLETLHAMGYEQELARRMTGYSNFAISLSIICIVSGGITEFPTAISTSSGFGVAVGWIVGSAFAMVVALALAQIGSAYPTAGGLYHWSSILGGRGWGWATAWFNLIGLIFVVAAVDVGAYVLMKGLVTPVFGIDATAWGIRAQTIAVVMIAGSQALFNHLGIRVTTILTDFSGYLIAVTAMALAATFLIWGSSWDLSRLVAFDNMTGASGGNLVPQPRSNFVAFLLSLLLPLFTITGFDASAHTSEETVNARVAVPLGIINAVFWSAALGFVLVASFVLASPDLSATAKDGVRAWFNLFLSLPAPGWLKAILSIAIVTANYLCGLACLTSLSRMIFAFARDGGMPGSGFWRRVSARWRTPVAAIWLGAALAVTSTLYSPAFDALASACALFLYLSYAMPIGAGLLAEGRSWTAFGPFRLGIWYKPLAVIALLGTSVLFYVGVQPPNDIVVNYSVGVFASLVVLWFGFERRRFSGPPTGDVLLARRSRREDQERAAGNAT